MKKSVLINVLCSVLIAVVMIIGIILAFGLTNETGIDKNKLVLSSSSVTAVYDGKTLSDAKWYLTEGELKEGHFLSVSVTGAQVGVGQSENYLYAKVFDGNGVEVTDEYDIEYRPGLLNVKTRELSLTADSARKLYDGTPLTCDGYRVDTALDLLPTDHLLVTVAGSQTEIGEGLNRITSVSIFNEANVDVTRNYSIQTNDGLLIVYGKDTLVVETYSASKTYDGIPLSKPGYSLVSGSLRTDHVLDVKVTGTQTVVGSSENTLTVRVFDEWNNDVTDTYDILCLPGTLSVIPATVEITSGTDSKTYDGTPLTNFTATVLPGSYQKQGFQFVPVIVGSQTEIGSSENTIQSCEVWFNGTNVTEYFKITTQCGTLTVLPEPLVENHLVFRSWSDSKEYDGIPLTNDNWELAEGDLFDGHWADVIVTGSNADIGIKDNTFQVVIRDSENNDVTDQYSSLSKEYGVLEVTKKNVTLIAGSAQKVFDGEPLTCEAYIVEPMSVQEQYIVECVTLGSRTKPGQSPNKISSWNIYVNEEDETLRDVTEYFNVTCKDGTLLVMEEEEDLLPELTYTSGSALKIYDGTPLSCEKIERVGELLEGHREVVTFISEITEVGECVNAYTVEIYDGEERVTDRYLIRNNYGTLKVVLKSITLVSASDEKIYDGTPLTNPTYTVRNTDVSDESPALMGEDYLKVSIIGSITEPGNTRNTVASVEIFNADNENVTSCYDVQKKEGILIVYAQEPVQPDVVVFEVTASKKDTIYLKMDSYGDYDLVNKQWLAAVEYSEKLAEDKSMYYLPALAMNNIFQPTEEIEITPKLGIFALPYYTEYDLNGEHANQDSDTVIKGNGNVSYKVTYYDWDQYAGAQIPDRYDAVENAYAQFVRDHYLTIDTQTEEFMLGIIAENGWSKSQSNIISAVAKYVQNAAEYNLKYDENADNVDNTDNPLIAFLSTHPEGVCRHYAQSATMLYRALGIPARYTQGFMGTVSADTVTEITAANAHAWVEVYVDNIGWLRVEVTGSAPSGQIQSNLEVAPVKTEVLYDGTEKVARQVVTGLDELCANHNYTYECVVSGARTEPGITTITVQELIIRNEKGDVIYQKSTGQGSDVFNISYKTSQLHVYVAILTFKSDGATQEYNGTPLFTSVDAVSHVGGDLEFGHYYEIPRMTASITKVGRMANGFEVKIYAENDGERILVNDWYIIKKEPGTLTVTPKLITITAGSDQKEYDGSALTCDTYTYDPSELVAGDYIDSVLISGSQTLPGHPAPNVIQSVVIKNAAGDEVTSCYQIETVNGTLTIIT